MKTVLEYLNECRNMAAHNQLCYSENYAMNTPKEGYETKFAEAVRDREIVDELIAMVKEKETPSQKTSRLTFSISIDNISSQLGKELRQELERSGIPRHLSIDKG